MAVFLGVALDVHSVSFVEAESLEEIRYLGRGDLPGSFGSDQYIAELIRMFKKREFGLRSKYEGIIFSVNSGLEIYRRVHFPFAKEQVEKAFQFEFYDQIRDVIKKEINDLLLDHIFINHNEKSSTVLALASPSEELVKIVGEVDKVDLDPEKVFPELASLQSFINSQLPIYATGNCFGLHTTDEGVIIYYLQKGLPIEVRVLPLKLGALKESKSIPQKSEVVGAGPKVVESEYEEEEEFYVVSSLTDKEIEEIAIKEEEENIPEGQEKDEPVSEDKNSVIKRVLVQLKRTSFLLPESPVDILVTGKYAYDKDLISAMSVISLKVFKDQKVDLSAASATGAATAFFQKDLDVFNLRKGPLAYKGFFEKIVGPLNICILLLLFVTITMSVFLSLEKDKAKKQQVEYIQYIYAMKEKIDPGTEMKPVGGKVPTTLAHIKTLSQRLDFEANAEEYEREFPIISCLRVWIEYEKALKGILKENVAVGKERSLNITQGTTGVVLSIDNAVTSDYSDLEKFRKYLLEKTKFFNEAQEKGSVINNENLVFDMNAQKSYSSFFNDKGGE